MTGAATSEGSTNARLPAKDRVFDEGASYATFTALRVLERTLRLPTPTLSLLMCHG